MPPDLRTRRTQTETTEQSVHLSEVEYLRLTTLVQGVRLSVYAAELARRQVAATEAARDAYMATLTQAYPALDFAGCQYRSDAETFTLHPVEPVP